MSNNVNSNNKQSQYLFYCNIRPWESVNTTKLTYYRIQLRNNILKWMILMRFWGKRVKNRDGSEEAFHPPKTLLFCSLFVWKTPLKLVFKLTSTWIKINFTTRTCITVHLLKGLLIIACLQTKWTVRLTTVKSMLINKNTSIYCRRLYSNDSWRGSGRLRYKPLPYVRPLTSSFLCPLTNGQSTLGVIDKS